MNRRSKNRPKETKTVSKSRKIRLDMCANIPRCCLVSAIQRAKTINCNVGTELSVSPQQRESVIAGIYFSQTSVTFAGDFAAVCNSEVSVIARCGRKAGGDCKRTGNKIRCQQGLFDGNLRKHTLSLGTYLLANKSEYPPTPNGSIDL